MIPVIRLFIYYLFCNLWVHNSAAEYYDFRNIHCYLHCLLLIDLF